MNLSHNRLLFSA